MTFPVRIAEYIYVYFLFFAIVQGVSGGAYLQSQCSGRITPVRLTCFHAMEMDLRIGTVCIMENILMALGERVILCMLDQQAKETKQSAVFFKQ